MASVVEFSAVSYDGSEAGGSGTVTVGLRATPSFSTSTTVSYRVGGTASSGADFTALAGALSMTGGGGSLAVSILEDRVDEEAETIVLQLDGGSGYTVVLESEPTAEVSITVTSGDPAAARVSPSSLRFSRSTWAVSQKVTVTGVDDDVEQSVERRVSIRHRAASEDSK